MATSQAAPATTAVVVSGGGTASTTSQTIFGSHIFSIGGFLATKDLGVGKSIKSSIFRVGGHSWYIECYPCGYDEASAGWVTLYPRRHKEDHRPLDMVRAKCGFTLMKPSGDDGCFHKLIGHGTKWITFANDDRLGTELIETKELVSLLNNDCFHVRCDLRIEKIPHPDLDTETMAGSHVLTIDEYSKTRRGLVIGEPIESSKFRVGGHRWYFVFYPCGEDNCYKDDSVYVNLFLDNPAGSDDEAVKVLVEIALLTDGGGQVISSTQDFSNFTKSSKVYGCGFLATMEHETWPLLQDGVLQIRCDITVVKKRITVMPNLRRSIGGDLQGSRQQIRVSGDVTFEVSGHLFEAHKCVLATRSTAFMADFIAPAGATDGPRVRVNDMEPRVFEALLHFIYTDALPEVRDDDMLVMAQGLLVAADRYGMERLKLICGDIMGTYVNDARTAIATLELADKHGCSRLKEVCIKFLKGHFAIGAP